MQPKCNTEDSLQYGGKQTLCKMLPFAFFQKKIRFLKEPIYLV